MNKNFIGVASHLMAFGLGVLLVSLWPNDREDRNAEPVGGRATGPARSREPWHAEQPMHKPSNASQSSDGLMLEVQKEISKADLESWIEEKKGSPLHAERLVIAGAICGDPDLVRQGIAEDPENAQLLSIGATFGLLSDQERLEMSQRLAQADPDNAFGNYLSAAKLLKAGDSQAALQALRQSMAKPELNDYRNATQLLREEAYAAAGLPPATAKMKATMDHPMEYALDFLRMIQQFKDIEGSMTPQEAQDLRAMSATLGQRVERNASSWSMMDQMTGFAIGFAIIKGMPDDAASPYEGMTVREARESLAAQRQQIVARLQECGSRTDQLLSDPQLMSQYIDRCRLLGEGEAMKWLIQKIPESD